MYQYFLYLPCPAGVQGMLRNEISQILNKPIDQMSETRTGVILKGTWDDALKLNLYTRLAQRVLIELSHGFYRNENDLYRAVGSVPWEDWFHNQLTFKVDVTAQHSPLTSLNFATLRIKDAVVDRFRDMTGERPSIDTHFPGVRLHVHLTTEEFYVYIDTSGEPLFKRGWRVDKGDAPLKETLAAAMIAACGWTPETPFYDPCCGSGTIAIEAAQIACKIAPGSQRRFGFQNLRPYQRATWDNLVRQARSQELSLTERQKIKVFGSDVSFRMVDFANRNAERAGVLDCIEFRGGDALQRMPPTQPGLMLVNPPYGERIEIAGVAGRSYEENQDASFVRHTGPGREQAQTEGDTDFFVQLASHWKKNFSGWTAWMLTPDLKLPSKMRLKESRRVPMWNGPIECRLFRFDLVAGSARDKRLQKNASPDAPLAKNGAHE